MKKFKNILFKLLTFIFIFILVLIIFTYIFSLRNNLSIEETISSFKTFVSGLSSNNNSVTINSNITNTTINNSATSITDNTKYYYNQLDDISKAIYIKFEDNIDNFKKENYILDFDTSFNDLLHKTTGQYMLQRAFQSALDAFTYDHPELFYLDISKISLNTKVVSIGPFKTYSVEISPKNTNYLHSNFSSEQAVNIAINKVENIKNSIINSVSNKNDYEKIKTVHDMLVNSLEYDSSIQSENVHNIYGALVEKKVVCEGYAKAFKYILDSLDIECILVSGDATNSSNKTEAHMWNYVKLNNSWYGVDITWDDPIVIGGNGKNNLRYDYFLKGRNTFIVSHIPSRKISDTGIVFSLPTLSNQNYR